MLLKRIGVVLLLGLLTLSVAQSAMADVIEFVPETNGQILINRFGLIDSTADSDEAAPASPASNPVTYVKNTVGANWVLQFKLSELPVAADILAVHFEVMMEGNTDKNWKFGVGHGAAIGTISAGDKMSPGPLSTYSVPGLSEPFVLDVTTAVKTALNSGDKYYRFALSGNPETNFFASASFYNPKLAVEVVPEPSTFACFGIGALVLGAWRYRRRPS